MQTLNAIKCWNCLFFFLLEKDWVKMKKRKNYTHHCVYERKKKWNNHTGVGTEELLLYLAIYHLKRILKSICGNKWNEIHHHHQQQKQCEFNIGWTTWNHSLYMEMNTETLLAHNCTIKVKEKKNRKPMNCFCWYCWLRVCNLGNTNLAHIFRYMITQREHRFDTTTNKKIQKQEENLL